MRNLNLYCPFPNRNPQSESVRQSVPPKLQTYTHNVDTQSGPGIGPNTEQDGKQGITY